MGKLTQEQARGVKPFIDRVPDEFVAPVLQAYLAGIAHGRAEQKAADAQICRDRANRYAHLEFWHADWLTQKTEADDCADAIESPPPPYPQFCRSPQACAGKTNCPRDPACTE